MAFQQNVHNFRAFAILGVVGAHSLQNFYWEENSLLFQALDTLFNQSTIWFAFIAGYLFQALSARYSTKKYYGKKLSNVITPYLICSIPALAASIALNVQEMPKGFHDYSYALQVLLFLVTGKHLAPYWYIPMITLIFICAPLLISIDRRPKYYHALWLLIPLSAYLGRDGLLVHTPLNAYFSQLSKAVYLLSPYMVGMLCSHYRENMLETVAKYKWPIVTVSLAFYSAEVLFYHQTTYFMYLFKVISAPLILWLLQCSFGRLQSVVDRIAADSFGLFFVHGYVLGVVRMGLGWLTPNDEFQMSNLLTFIVFWVFVVSFSLLLIQIVKMVVGSRWSVRLIGC